MLKIIVRSFFPDWKPETLQGVSQECTSLNKVLIDKVPFHRCVLESRQSRPTWRPASTPPPTSARRAERRWCYDRRHCCCRCGRRRWDLCVGNAVLRRRWRRRLGSMTRHFFAVTDVSTPPPGYITTNFWRWLSVISVCFHKFGPVCLNCTNASLCLFLLLHFDQFKKFTLDKFVPVCLDWASLRY